MVMPNGHHQKRDTGKLLDLRKLRYFVEVVTAGGFRRASQSLNIAQPALTRQILALEEDLGTQLLFRFKAGVKPTPQGQVLLGEAQEILARTDALRALLSPDRSQVSGVVRLGMPSALADMHLGAIVKSVRAKYPAVQIICREGSVDLIGQVENGGLDLAVASVMSTRTTYHCHVQYLLKEQEYLIGLDRLCPEGSSMSVNELFSKPLVLTPSPNARRDYLEGMARRRRAKLHVVAEAMTMSAQRDLLLHGLGCAVLPLSAARPMTCNTDLRMLPIDGQRSWRVLLKSLDADNSLVVDAVGQEISQILVTSERHDGDL